MLPPGRRPSPRPGRGRRRRPRVVNDLAARVERELLALFNQRQKAAVAGVARRVEDARDPHAIPGPERLDVPVAEWRSDLLDPVGRRRHAHSVTSLCRCAWHSMVTATGSEVMWQGYVRMWMPNAVVSPPYP